jgi:hypothetical protein
MGVETNAKWGFMVGVVRGWVICSSASYGRSEHTGQRALIIVDDVKTSELRSANFARYWITLRCWVTLTPDEASQRV